MALPAHSSPRVHIGREYSETLTLLDLLSIPGDGPGLRWCSGSAVDETESERGLLVNSPNDLPASQTPGTMNIVGGDRKGAIANETTCIPPIRGIIPAFVGGGVGGGGEFSAGLRSHLPQVPMG